MRSTGQRCDRMRRSCNSSRRSATSRSSPRRALSGRDTGCIAHTLVSQGPLVHATGKGWVKEGQYYDALHVKNGIVKICLVESQGGIAPPTKRIIFNFAKEVGSPSAVDRTDYGTASGSARPGLCPAPLATALARRRLWRRAKHQQRCSQHACRALIHDRSRCPTCARTL